MLPISLVSLSTQAGFLGAVGEMLCIKHPSRCGVVAGCEFEGADGYLEERSRRDQSSSQEPQMSQWWRECESERRGEEGDESVCEGVEVEETDEFIEVVLQSAH